MIIRRRFFIKEKERLIAGNSMTDLELARKEIETADREIAALFEKRMRAVETIGAYKIQNGLPVYDAAREQALLDKNSAFIENDLFRSYYVSFQQSVMSLSKRYQYAMQRGLKIAFCGVQGAFAERAAIKLFPNGEPVSYPDFDSAYSAVSYGDCDCCVLPIENSYFGEVGQVIDLMFNGDLYVSGVYSLQIRHYLLGVPGASVGDIKTVLSHPQALGQCARYIRDHGFTAKEASNTAVAAETVSKTADPSVAAIAGKETAALYGLQVLDHDVNASAVNTTRFAVFSRSRKERRSTDNVFILLFQVTNTVGALAKAVNIISANGFDMRVLRSRPVKDVPWQYYFYVEAQGDVDSEDGQRMLRALSVCCEKLKVAGCYSPDLDLEKMQSAEAEHEH